MSAAIAAAAAGANTAAPAVAAATKPRKIKARPVHVRLHAEPTVVLVIPCDDVVQQPPKSVGTMYLCEAYGLPGGCPRGEDCVEVHASTLKATKFTFHEKAESWTDASDIPYPCFPAGETLDVAKPNAEDEMEMFAANHVLATRALEMARRPLSHCAHFLWKGFCTRGAECEFIHAVKLASAEDAADVSSESSTPMEVSLVESQRSSPAESPARTMASTVRRYRHDPYDRSWMSPVISRVPSMVRRNDPYRSPWMVPSAVASRTISRAEYSLSTEYDAVPANVARSSGSGSSTPASRASGRARTPELMTL